MDKRIQLNEDVLRGKFLLPADTSIIRVTELDEKTQKQVCAERDDDLAISRPKVRASSRIVNSEFGELINSFREPTTIPVAVANYCRETPDEAEKVFTEALPILLDLVQHAILVSEHDSATQEISFSLAKQEKFNGFVVQQQIQLFAESEVYQVRALQNETGEQFRALKIVRDHCPDTVTQTLRKEFKILTELSDEANRMNFECGESHGRFWFVMPWICGRRADQVAAELRTSGDRGKLLQLLSSIIDGYRNLHAAGYLHGDIHPGNILVDRHYQAHIIDFGNAENASNLSSNGNHAKRGGVAFYFEPEYASAMISAQKIPAVSTKSEQFALAALCYQLVTGNHYDDFELEQQAMFKAIANAAPKPFIEQDIDAWPMLESVLQKALSIDPTQRFNDLADFHQNLQQCAPPVACEPIRRQAEFLEDFIKLSIGRLDGDADAHACHAHPGPCASLNGGAAGVAYALTELACAKESPNLLAKAEVWLHRARIWQDEKHAFMNTNHVEQYAMVGSTSTHHAAPSITFVALFFSLIKNDRNRFYGELKQFLIELDNDCESIDTTLGNLSAVLAIARLLKHGFDPALGEGMAMLTDAANGLLDRSWQQLSKRGPMTLRNLGFAHGWAGVLYTTLLWHHETAYPLPTQFASQLRRLNDQLIPAGRGLAIEWLDESNQSMGIMSGWCNGSAGLLHLYALLSETEQGGVLKKQWFNIAESLAWHCWEANAAPIDLCCGSAGRIFALLRFAALSQDEAWSHRARQLARAAIDRSPSIENEEHPRHSLFKGDMGLALAAQAALQNRTISMPMMGSA